MAYDEQFFDTKFENYSEKDGNAWGFNWRASQIRRHNLAEKKLNEILAWKEEQEDVSLCELGCASGDFTARYCEKIKNVKAVCSDLSGKAIALCKSRFRRFENIVFKQEDILDIQESDNSFDIAICMDVLHYFDEEKMRKAINEIQRIMKKDGYVLLLIPLPWEGQWGDNFKGIVQEKFEVVSECYVDNLFYQNYLEPVLLYWYGAFQNGKILGKLWSGFQKGLRRLLMSQRLLELWIGIGRVFGCRRQNSHIMLIGKPNEDHRLSQI